MASIIANIRVRRLRKRLTSVTLDVGLQSGANVNDWDIPDWLEEEVKERDKACVYCGVPMVDKMRPSGPGRSVATWEHIINNRYIINRENIARCCVACNSSKGNKDLSVWMQSSYCRQHGINRGTVAEVVKKALQRERRDT
jgi:uncharacterized protein (DUF927 family)